jgi:hypothetical protein
MSLSFPIIARIAKGEADMALLVGLVTPADDQSPTYKVFDDELHYGFGWPQTTLKCYPAKDYGNDISAAAGAAFTDVKNSGGVLVAAGEMAANFLQEETKKDNNKIPIILAYGGQPPPNRAKNMTGFVGSCVDVGKHHRDKLTGHKVTVLYDPDKNNQAHDRRAQRTKKRFCTTDSDGLTCPISSDQF